MKILIKETREVKTLSLISPKTNIDYVADFIGNHGGFCIDIFDYDDYHDIYHCDQDTFDWWEKVINNQQDLDNRILLLTDQFGYERVVEAINNAHDSDLEHHAYYMNKALDEII
jgi:hypothetical protein